MNIRDVYASCREAGYQGDESIESLSAWVRENNVRLVDESGAAVDLKSLAAAPQPMPEAAASDAEQTLPSAPSRVITARSRGSGAGRARVSAVEHDVVDPRPPSVARKAYEHRARRGETAFHDADTAEHFAAWMRLTTCRGLRIDYPQQHADEDIVTKAGLSTVTSLGGALVPQDFLPAIIDLIERYGVARRIANVVPMSRDTMTIPRQIEDVAMAHVSEGSSIGDSDITYDVVTLTAKKCAALSFITTDLIEDSAISVADRLAATFARAAALREDKDYFLGDGTSTYGGHVGLSTALPAGAYITGSGSSWSALTLADFHRVQGSVENIADARRLAWVCSRQFYFQVMDRLDKASLKAITGGPGAAGDATFLGTPVYFAQVLPVSSASGQTCAYYGDFAAASMLGDRREFTVAASEHFRFQHDQIAYRATMRFAVNIHGDGRGSTVGPIAALQTA